MERVGRETWAKRIERWTDSGLTAKEFAAELGIRPDTLKWWKWRLGAKGRASQSRPKPAPTLTVRRSPAPITPLTFIEMTAAVRSDPIEVVLPTEIRVRVPSTFDEGALARVLDVLERRR
jgi:hypothetical protein